MENSYDQSSIPAQRFIIHFPENHRFGISVISFIIRRDIYRYRRDLSHRECSHDTRVLSTHIIHQSKISNYFLVSSCTGQEMIRIIEMERDIYIYCNTSIVYNKMNLISVVIYRHDWIRYLCGVIEIFMEYHREMKDSFILENVYKYRDTRICFG